MQRTIIVPKKREYILGGIYWLIYLVVSELLLTGLFRLMGMDLYSEDALFLLNFAKLTIDFVALVLIFQDYLRRSWSQVRWTTPLLALRTVAIYYGISLLTGLLNLFVSGGVQSVNQSAVQTLTLGRPLLMCICTVIYAPVAEELMFRGTLYAPFVRKHPMTGSLLTAFLFAGIHVVSSIAFLPWYAVLVTFLQYLPTGFCMCYMYRRTGTIWGSIFTHMLINLQSMLLINLLGKLI